MKKLLILIFAITFVLTLKGQQKGTAYYTVKNETEKYPITLTYNNENDFEFSIQIESYGEEVPFYLFVTEENYEAFRYNIKRSLTLYKKWKSVAIDNNVQDFSKQVDKLKEVTFIAGYNYNIPEPKYVDDMYVYFTFSIWNYSYKPGLNYNLEMVTGNLKLGNNKYIDGGRLMFMSEQEIQHFIDLIDIENFPFKENLDSLFTS